MSALLLASFLLTSGIALAEGPTEIIDESQNPESRAAWNIAIMKVLAGVPDNEFDARQRAMIKKLRGLGRDIKPLPEGSDLRELQARLSDDQLRYNTILSMRDPYSGSYDTKAMKALTDAQKDPIGKYWGIANGRQPPPPMTVLTGPPSETEPKGDGPANPTGMADSPPGSNPAGGPAGPAGGFNPGGGPDASPGGSAPNAGPDGQGGPGGQGGPNLGKLRGTFSKALGEAKDGAGSFDLKEDNSNLAPPAHQSGQGHQGRPGTGRPGETRDRPSRPEPGAPGNSAAGGFPTAVSAGRAFPPPATASPALPRQATAAPVSRPRPRPRYSPSISPSPGGPAFAPPGMSSDGPPLPRLDPRPSAERGSSDEDPLTEEELAAIQDIQAMLAAASGEAPLDTNALRDGADKLDAAAAGAAWKGVDVDSLRDQISRVLEMAGLQGLSLTQQQVVYQAAANLGLSDLQAGRIIKALRISEPPSPRLTGMNWWQRLLTWARYHKMLLVRRLL